MPLPILPNTAFRRVARIPLVAQGGTVSPFSFEAQVQNWGGEAWSYEIEFWSQTGDDGRALSAFFTALKGRSGSFILKDPSAFNTASVGTPLVNGALQTGESIVTDGWTPSITVLKAGYFIQLGTDATTRLHMVTADAVSDGAGNATLSIWPALRESPADDAAIVIDEPGVVLRLDAIPSHSIAPNESYSFTMTATEVL